MPRVLRSFIDAELQIVRFRPRYRLHTGKIRLEFSGDSAAAYAADRSVVRIMPTGLQLIPDRIRQDVLHRAAIQIQPVPDGGEIL